MLGTDNGGSGVSLDSDYETQPIPCDSGRITATSGIELKLSFFKQQFTFEKLVEAAGIEPASASPLPLALHAYPRLFI